MKRKLNYLLIAFVLGLLIIKLPLYSQSVEEVKKKVQESGMTEAEAKAKAEAAGYSLEDLKKLQQSGEQNDLDVDLEADQTNEDLTPPNQSTTDPYSVRKFKGRSGAEGLRAFGYNIFNYSSSTFEPSSNVPIPTSYVVGPGDEIIISLWGETQLVQDLTVSKNGDFYIPNVGLVNVNGLTIAELKNKLFNVLSNVYASLKNKDGEASTKLDVSTGKLRSVKVYVLGEVNTPGGYTLPAMSTAFTLLYYSGGPKISGTLRYIQVLRDGKKIANIDLYNYLLKGDQSKDILLEDGDIIFVPPVGDRVALAGEVFRPAIYELKDKNELKDLLVMAGGLDLNAYYQTVHIERVIPFNERKNYTNDILDITLNFDSVYELKGSNYTVVDGDIVSIRKFGDTPENRVTITGNVKKPGIYELKENMTIRDLVFQADSIYPSTFMEKAVLIRTLPTEKEEIITFNLQKAIDNDPENNIELQNFDVVQIFNLNSFFPSKSIQIAGQVKNPGTYTRLENMTLSKLIMLAGGLTEIATLSNIEITRLDTLNSEIYSEKVLFNLPKDYWNVDLSNDFVLKAFDRVLIKVDPAKTFAGTVTISGQVNNPGTYALLYEGEKITDVIKRAGGFKSTAYTEAIHIVRNNPIFNQPVTYNPENTPDSIKENLFGKLIYNQSNLIKNYTNKIPIEWDEVLRDSSSIYNISLERGDELVIPKDPHGIFVLGLAQIPSTVPYKKGAGLNYYIKQAGGYQEVAAEGDEIVIKPNGSKWESSGWFFIPNEEIPSGSTIIIPGEMEGPSAWPVIRDVITVMSSAAIVIATIINLTN